MSQEQGNAEASNLNSVSEESPVSISDAHTAMEYYLFADSPDTFHELSSESLAHLYILKVQGKPLKVIRRFSKKTLIEALMKVVSKLLIF